MSSGSSTFKVVFHDHPMNVIGLPQSFDQVNDGHHKTSIFKLVTLENQIHFLGHTGMISPFPQNVILPRRFCLFNKIQENDFVKVSPCFIANEAQHIALRCPSSSDYELLNTAAYQVEGTLINQIPVVSLNTAYPVSLSSTIFIQLLCLQEDNRETGNPVRLSSRTEVEIIPPPSQKEANGEQNGETKRVDPTPVLASFSQEFSLGVDLFSSEIRPGFYFLNTERVRGLKRLVLMSTVFSDFEQKKSQMAPYSLQNKGPNAPGRNAQEEMQPVVVRVLKERKEEEEKESNVLRGVSEQEMKRPNEFQRPERVHFASNALRVPVGASLRLGIENGDVVCLDNLTKEDSQKLVAEISLENLLDGKSGLEVEIDQIVRDDIDLAKTSLSEQIIDALRSQEDISIGCDQIVMIEIPKNSNSFWIGCKFALRKGVTLLRSPLVLVKRTQSLLNNPESLKAKLKSIINFTVYEPTPQVRAQLNAEGVFSHVRYFNQVFERFRAVQEAKDFQKTSELFKQEKAHFLQQILEFFSSGKSDSVISFGIFGAKQIGKTRFLKTVQSPLIERGCACYYFDLTELLKGDYAGTNARHLKAFILNHFIHSVVGFGTKRLFIFDNIDEVVKETSDGDEMAAGDSLKSEYFLQMLHEAQKAANQVSWKEKTGFVYSAESEKTLRKINAKGMPEMHLVKLTTPKRPEIKEMFRKQFEEMDKAKIDESIRALEGMTPIQLNALKERVEYLQRKELDQKDRKSKGQVFSEEMERVRDTSSKVSE